MAGVGLTCHRLCRIWTHSAESGRHEIAASLGDEVPLGDRHFPKCREPRNDGCSKLYSVNRRRRRSGARNDEKCGVSDPSLLLAGCVQFRGNSGDTIEWH